MQPAWKYLRPLSIALLLCTVIVAFLQIVEVHAASSLVPQAFDNPNTTIFINEFHYDNAGTDSGEFVEVAGPSGSDLSGWTIALYNGSNGALYDTDALPTEIPNLGCAYGFAVVSYPSNGLQNGSPDGIALVDNNGNVVQFLSYEGAFVGSGGPANGLTSTDIGAMEPDTTPVGQSLQLSSNGTQYQDFDWNPPAAATPGGINTGQTFGASDAPPCLTSVTPANKSSNVARNANITLNFTEAITVSGTWYNIICSSSGSHTAAVSGGPQSFTLDPDTDFANGESCTVTLTGSQIVDQDGTAQAMTADVSWSFNTVLLFGTCNDGAETPIHAIQGSGKSSPRLNTAAVIEGVVVGDYQGSGGLSGFFVQEEEADADADPATSEALFVFNSTAVNAGDVVRLQGTVNEFGGTGATLTEMVSVTQLQICASGAAVTPTTIEMPVSSPADWERVEGMLVKIPEQLTATENFTLGRFGELVLSANGRLFTPTHLVAPGAPAQAQQAANDLNRITLDDGKGTEDPDPVIYPSPYLSATNTLRSGYTVENLTGVLDQRFDLYRIQPVGTVAFSPTNPRTTAPENVGGTLKIASANVLNYFTTLDQGGNQCGPPGHEQECRGANSAAEFDRQRAKTIAGLGAINADIIGLLELENNPTASLDNLVSGLNALPGVGPYAYINTGYIGTDAIKVGIIYKPATVTPLGNYAILNSTVDPTFIDNLNRPTLAQSFEVNATTERLTVAINHLKSKGSDCNLVGDPDTGDGQGNCNKTRTSAAAAVVKWLASDPTGSGDPDFLIIGDMNAYAMEDPITTFKSGGYTDLFNRFHGQAAYSYVFDAQSGYLDHALANASLNAQIVGAAEWHVNTDEPVVLDYNVEFKSPAQVNYLYSPAPYRFSDHDPLVVGLNLHSETTITIVKDAQPNNIRNFRFSGDLGDFRLDDPGRDDHDGVGSSITFDVKAGSYTVAEDVPYFWHLTNLVCTGGATVVDLAHQRVAISVIAGQKVTCTFTNSYGSDILVAKYNDHNANGKRFLEAGLPGWTMSLYNQVGALIASDATNILGITLFQNVAPGQYTLCETQRSGWSNSQPGTTNPTYHQPCYTLNVAPAQLWYVEFGNYRGVRAAGEGAIMADEPTVSELTVKNVDDESYEDDGSFLDLAIEKLTQGDKAPLYLPQITR